MEHQVLARKWRPRVFSEVIGQEQVLQVLQNALLRKRLHSAYLFTGTRGVGKTSIARIFARCLNCKQGLTAEPCGECNACQEIERGTYPDLVEVDAASRTGVDDTRQLLEDAYYPPAAGRYKVYLIDEVHMLSNNSFNAMLKTLEEPPEQTLFVLATTDPQKIPPTILSRCLQLALSLLPAELIAEHLGFILGKEGIASEVEALHQLAVAARGSMRDGLTLTDQAIHYTDSNITAEQVSKLLGTLDKGLIADLARALCGTDTEATMDAARRVAQTGNCENALEQLLELLHGVAMVQVTGASISLDTSSEQRDVIAELAAATEAEKIQLLYQIGLLGRRDLELAYETQQVFEMLLLRMLAFTPYPDQALSEPTPEASAPKPEGRAQPQPQVKSKSPSTASQAPEAVADEGANDAGSPTSQPSETAAAPAATKAPAPQTLAPQQHGKIETPADEGANDAGPPTSQPSEIEAAPAATNAPAPQTLAPQTLAPQQHGKLETAADEGANGAGSPTSQPSETAAAPAATKAPAPQTPAPQQHGNLETAADEGANGAGSPTSQPSETAAAPAETKTPAPQTLAPQQHGNLETAADEGANGAGSPTSQPSETAAAPAETKTPAPQQLGELDWAQLVNSLHLPARLRAVFAPLGLLRCEGSRIILQGSEEQLQMAGSDLLERFNQELAQTTPWRVELVPSQGAVSLSPDTHTDQLWQEYEHEYRQQLNTLPLVQTLRKKYGLRDSDITIERPEQGDGPVSLADTAGQEL